MTGWGGVPVCLGIARDTPRSVGDHLDRAKGLDLLVTVGGASVGDHDHLRAVFAARGGRLAFERIAVRPGKPTWFGRLGGLPCLGLPGNPVSALVMARLMLKPALDRLQGARPDTGLATAPLGAGLPANGARETYVRARFAADGSAVPLDNQDSSALSALVRADCLIRRPIEAPPAAAGEPAEILRLRQGG